MNEFVDIGRGYDLAAPEYLVLQVDYRWTGATTAYSVSVAVRLDLADDPLFGLGVPHEGAFINNAFGKYARRLTDNYDVPPANSCGKWRVTDIWLFSESMLERVFARVNRQFRRCGGNSK